MKHTLPVLTSNAAPKSQNGSTSTPNPITNMNSNPNTNMTDTTNSAVTPAPVETTSAEVFRSHVGVLDETLPKLKPMDWLQVQSTSALKDIEDTQVFYTVEEILRTVKEANVPIVNHASAIHCFNGKCYEQIDETRLMCFLVEAARRCAVPTSRAVFQTFARKICKQILINSAWRNGGVIAPDTPYINLQNGTLYFGKDGYRFEPQHSPHRFIRYCLGFNYDPKATPTKWQEHLDRALPDKMMQAYLAAALALPFYPGKIEKIPILYGRRDTGKSTTLDVYKALIGSQNCSAATLAALTRITDTGDYHRAQLDGKLVNIASDISTKIGDEGLMKTLASREPLTVRRMRHQPFEMVNYARLMFALNEMPPKLFEDLALTKRVALIGFEQRIAAEKIETGFAEQIIANELPGVLNWLLSGLNQLRETGRLDPPSYCVALMEHLRIEVDPLSAWLDERRYFPGDSETITVKGAYPDFVKFCKEEGHTGTEIPKKRAISQRLRDLGFTVKAPNNRVGLLLYYTKCADAGSQTEPCNVSLPLTPTFAPAFDATNTGGGSDGSDGSKDLTHVSEEPQAKPKVRSKSKPQKSTKAPKLTKASKSVSRK
jgi:putative DNA primase/helicase